MEALYTALCLLGIAAAQQMGTVTVEAPPTVPVQNCTVQAGCTTQQAAVTLDANWRWVHDKDGYQNCFTGTSWDAKLCPDPKTCTEKCAIEGVDAEGYQKSYGVRPSREGVVLGFVSKGGGNVGSRLYVTEGNSSSQVAYKMFKLKNREFTFDVDVSKLPCGVNGALYFVEMPADGGKGNSSTAGARFGTGYCDAQCPHDVKWINGEANSKGWNPQSSAGHYGSCCAEMDIWEANSMASAYTPHPCNITGPLRCSGSNCGDTAGGERYLGVCDKDGCDWNSYRVGDDKFYGPGLQVDTTKNFTVVTQFLTTSGTDDGDLSEIRRWYVQDGNVIENSNANILEHGLNAITDNFCQVQKAAFNDPNDFAAKGGLKHMGDALGRGMVLVLSIWDDSATGMTWLDAAWPADKAADEPGVRRGPCTIGSGKPEYVRSTFPDARVAFTNIKVGELGSTFSTVPRRLKDVHV